MARHNWNEHTPKTLEQRALWLEGYVWRIREAIVLMETKITDRPVCIGAGGQEKKATDALDAMERAMNSAVAEAIADIGKKRPYAGCPTPKPKAEKPTKKKKGVK